MALKQPATSPVWTEPKGSGASSTFTNVALVDDGRGGYTFRALDAGEDPAARMLADGRGGFTVSDGPNNPTDLAELGFVDIGNGNIVTYE